MLVNGVPVAVDETAREVNERQGLPAGGLRERFEQVAADNGPTPTILLFQAYNRPIWLISHRRGRAAWFMAIATKFGIGSHNRLDRSTVGKWLALRPEFSAQALMPPTALLAPRGGRRGLLVLTAGPVQDFLSALSHRPGGFVPT